MTLINNLPNPPLRSDGFSSSEAETFLEALPAFVTETNTTLDYFNLRNADASAVTMWVTGSYDEGDVVWSPLTGKNYRAKGAHTSATDPSADSTNWSLATGLTTGDQDKLDLLTVTEAINLDTLNVRPTMTADGAISKGDVLVRQNDGTVAGVTSAVSGPATGSVTTFNAASTFIYADSIAYHPVKNIFLIVYVDSGNSNYGTAVVASVDGTSITYGTPVVFSGTASAFPSVVEYNPDEENFLITYKDGTSNTIKSLVCTVSGTTPSFGSATEHAYNGFAIYIAYDTGNNKFVIFYTVSADAVYAVVASTSGTTVTFGTREQIVSSADQPIGCEYDAISGKVVVVSGSGVEYKAYLGTVSGTAITFGTPTTLASVAGDQDGSVIIPKRADGEFILAYLDGGGGDHGYVVFFSIASSTITPGSPVKFNAADTSVLGGFYDANDGEYNVVFKDGGNSNYLTLMQATIASTVPSFSAFSVIASEGVSFGGAVGFSASESTALFGFRGASNYGKAVAYTTTSITTDADSWFSIAANDVADGEDAQLFTLGDLAGGLSGLTIGADYYVDVDGNLTTSVTSYGKIGRALSATELLITGTHS